MVIQELASIITMQFLDGKRQACQDTTESFLHAQLPASENRNAFAPACSNIYQLQCVDEVTSRSRTAMIGQIDFEVSGSAMSQGMRRMGMALAIRLARSGLLRGRWGVSCVKRERRRWTIAT